MKGGVERRSGRPSPFKNAESIMTEGRAEIYNRSYLVSTCHRLRQNMAGRSKRPEYTRLEDLRLHEVSRRRSACLSSYRWR